MPKKLPKAENKPEKYIQWSGRLTNEALEGLARNVDSCGMAEKAIARSGSFKNIDTNISARQGFGRDNYEFFRDKEQVAKNIKEAMQMCDIAYQKVGLIRNVIDLMSDFACQGIKVVHPNARIEKLHKQWFEQVKGRERSERFVSVLLRMGNVVVRRVTAKMRVADMDRLRRAIAEPDVQPEWPGLPGRNEIPWRYDFINPVSVKVVGGEVASFVGVRRHAIEVNSRVRERLLNPKTDIEKELIKQIPVDVMAALRNTDNGNTIPLDPDKTFIFHYKKDDWKEWAEPMIYSILDNVIMLEKLQLTDMAACDGAISNIRLWRLGDLEHKVLPTQAALDRLRDVLSNNVGGGVMDLVWGPELDFKESATEVHRYLGSEKYEPTLNAIYGGLGIPPTLTGTATSGGFTNNYISLKTLIERLEYVRSVVTAFWNQELLAFQQAMGFKQPGYVQYNRMTLSDEAAEKALLLQLLDRNVISDETVLERFNENPDVEKSRVNQEERSRQAGTKPSKRSSLTDPKNDFAKLFITAGLILPKDVGLEVDDAQVQKLLRDKNKGAPGRPINSKDGGPRKKKIVQPRVAANLLDRLLWAKSAYETVTSEVSPLALGFFKKNTLRELTTKQEDELENLKLMVMAHMKYGVEPTTETVKEAITNRNVKQTQKFMAVYSQLTNSFITNHKREPTADEKKSIVAYAYTNMELSDG